MAFPQVITMLSIVIGLISIALFVSGKEYLEGMGAIDVRERRYVCFTGYCTDPEVIGIEGIGKIQDVSICATC
jgi:hypothetical protein